MPCNLKKICHAVSFLLQNSWLPMNHDNEIKTLLPISYLLPLIILIEGFTSIAIEILAIRQLLPLVGSSIIVTSLIIGGFLLFLALGYRKGGKRKDNLTKSLRTNFIVSAIWLGIGLSYCFILLFFSEWGLRFGDNVFYPLIGYLLIIISPLIYILGQTVPVIMSLTKQNKSIGMIGGNTLGLSTAGSFLGATITALVLMHFFGVAWTVFINFLLLLFLYLLLVPSKKSFLIQLTIAMPVIALIYYVNITFEKRMFVLTNNYANYQMIDHNNQILSEGEKILSINQSASSFINKNNKGFPYIETIKKILFDDMKLQDAHILVLGAGGFTLSAENTYGNHFTYVDIDKNIKQVTVPQFISHINGKLIDDDARHFIHTNKDLFKAIIVDTFSNTRTIPGHLLTQEYFAELKQRLAANGVIIFNIIAKPSLEDAYSKRVDNSIRHIFKNCMVMPLTYENVTANIIYVCTNSANQNDKTIYSDNLNSVTIDSFFHR